MVVAETIRHARAEAGITQSELARRAGIRQASISKFETGRERPRPETYARILEAVRVSPDVALRSSGGEGHSAVTDDSVAAVLDDIRRLIADGSRIVASGRTRFFDAGDRTLRLAATAIVFGIQSAAERLPDRFRQQYPAVAWDELRAMSGYLEQDSSTDFRLVWNALSSEFPRLGHQLGL